MNGITFQTSIWLSTAYRTMTPSVDGADLSVGVDMQDITFDTGDIGSNSLAMTFQSTCAIIDNGTVKCWGTTQTAVSETVRAGQWASIPTIWAMPYR